MNLFVIKISLRSLLLLGMYICVINNSEAKNALSYVNTNMIALPDPPLSEIIKNGESEVKLNTDANEINAPVAELISFTSEVTENSVAINWITLKESNTELYTIEKSKDGKNWTEVVDVSAKGNKIDLTNYSILDEEPFIGTSYYRIRNNSFSISAEDRYIATIRVFNPEVPVSISPNIIMDWLDVKSNSDELIELTLNNDQGRDVMQNVQVHLKNEDRIVVNVNELPEGVYTLKTATQTRMFYKI